MQILRTSTVKCANIFTDIGDFRVTDTGQILVWDDQQCQWQVIDINLLTDEVIHEVRTEALHELNKDMLDEQVD